MQNQKNQIGNQKLLKNLFGKREIIIESLEFEEPPLVNLTQKIIQILFQSNL
ncbi:unnamed protein product [Paramecium sonneborni]|uniref:Uncharacterized protein n=1 Tax=Paramecium sonneborni TaxID=65129 RepID=A0A8S1LY94_9CILI|nr:unnamed protein product [Paramecium sonneborni]